MLQKRPTSFLDLSLELRQMIYNYVVSFDTVMHFSAGQYHVTGSTVYAVGVTHPKIKAELEESIHRGGCDAHIIVKPHEATGLPPHVEWHRFQRIVVTIKHFEDHDRPCRWAGMRELVERLSERCAKTLPDIIVRFDEDQDAPVRGDRLWTDDVEARSTYRWHGLSGDCDDNCKETACHTVQDDPNDHLYDYISDSEDEDYTENPQAYRQRFERPPEKSHNVWLRTTGDYYGNPVAMEVLDCLLDLPPCRSAVVHPLVGFGLRHAMFPRYDPRARIFDGNYVEDICNALERWLTMEGQQGMTLPGGIGKEFGQSRLEQLAYTSSCGVLYCDGR